MQRIGCDVAGAGKVTSAPGAIAQALKDDLLDGAIAPGTRLTEEALSTRLHAMCSYRLILEMGALRLALVVGADFSEVSRAVEHLESLTEETAWRHVIVAHSARAPAIVEASGNARLVSAHRSCQDELNVMLATIRGDFSARRLAILHRDLLEQLYIGGDVALRALESDLELGGRAGMLLALRRQRGTTTPAIA
jgi:DNA-binding GntR family transcriptional regulator